MTEILQVIKSKIERFGNKSQMFKGEEIALIITTIESLQTEYADERTAHNFHVTELLQKDALIESQKEEIEKWKKEALANHPTQWAYDQACAALNKKTELVESLQKENERWNSLRPEVQWFAEQMENVLQANDHKGGWDKMSYWQLKARLDEEVREVELAYFAGHDAERLIREATDVANFAMMIADNSRIWEGESHE